MITVICFTLNEERNIANFCDGYDFADKILIADGGSSDKTKEIASQYEKVEIIDTSHLQIPTPNNSYQPFRTLQSSQVNVLIKRANKLKSTWIVIDDCDSRPNPKLKAEARLIFATIEQSAIFAYHLYILGQDKYFPKMNKPGPGLWAWQPDIVDIYADETNTKTVGLRNVPVDGFKIKLPMARLHYFAPNEETIQRKIASKLVCGDKMIHPLEWQYAPAEPLPEWATTL